MPPVKRVVGWLIIGLPSIWASSSISRWTGRCASCRPGAPEIAHAVDQIGIGLRALASAT